MCGIHCAAVEEQATALYLDRRPRDAVVVVAAVASRWSLQTASGMAQVTDSGQCGVGREMARGLDRRLDTETMGREMARAAGLEKDLGRRRGTETRELARARANTVDDFVWVELARRLCTDRNDRQEEQVRLRGTNFDGVAGVRERLRGTSCGGLVGVLERLPCMSSGDVAEVLGTRRGI